jgi:hypothetical protein
MRGRGNTTKIFSSPWPSPSRERGFVEFRLYSDYQAVEKRHEEVGMLDASERGSAPQ